MRYHISLKFIAILLAAVTLLGVVGSAVGIICLTSANLYNESVDELYEEQMASTRRSFAVNIAHRYASLYLGNCPESYLNEYFGNSWMFDTFRYGYYFYTIKDETGTIVESTLDSDLEGASHYTIQVTDIRYRSAVQLPGAEEPADTSNSAEDAQTTPTEEPTGATEAESADPSVAAENPTDTASATETEATEPPQIHQDGYWDPYEGQYVEFAFRYADLPPYTVDLYLLPGAMPQEHYWLMLKAIWQYRFELFYVLGVSLLAFAVVLVYLCCAAGREPKSDKIRPGGLNRLPLDLYGGACVFLIAFLVAVGWEMLDYLIRESTPVSVPFAILVGFACCLLVVGFLYACITQFKTPGGYWWRHSFIGWCLLKIWRFAKWIVGGVRKWIIGGTRRLISMLPVIWQWLLTAAVMVVWVGITFLLAVNTHGGWRFVFLMMFLSALVSCVFVVCYGAYCFGTLMRGAQQMAKGDLDKKIPTKYLFGAFRDFADQLNALADAAQLAAAKQMRSERMKTELITNVSHDIKTPLTSLINYVDLLQKPHTEEEGAMYLEVLQRQSQRLKKLVDDLMDMSKASSGNMVVDTARMDAAETIKQTLGEFGDKLALAELTPVFRAPDQQVFMMADGRLVWRIMSNLLGNAVKYALPGTRLYVDLTEQDGKVIISLKNISREELNVSADELLERFVRGDASRNTEGSGLGLNIAQSLMEIQRGQLELLVDGDLFKVTLIFPGAE